MKRNLILSIITSIIFINFSMAQEKKIPDDVLKAFSNFFTGAQVDHWEVNEQAVYAYFLLKEKKRLARFKHDGHLTGLGKKARMSDIPNEVFKAFKAKYPEFSSNKIIYYDFSNSITETGIMVITADNDLTRFILFSHEGKFLRDESFDIHIYKNLEKEGVHINPNNKG